MNPKLFAPPVKLNRRQEERLKVLGDPQFIVTLDGASKHISIEQYRARKKVPNDIEPEFIVTIPNQYKSLLKADNFRVHETTSAIRAAIRSLPSHIQPAFTVSEYLDPTYSSYAANEKEWPLNIVGFDPHIPPPIRMAPKFELKNNFYVPPPKSVAQHKFWIKNWKRLEKLIFIDIRVYLQEMIKVILIEIAKKKLEQNLL